MAALTYINVFARDIERLSRFYMDLLGFTEIAEIRTPIFVGIETGPTGSAIGFNAHEAYDLLGLAAHAETSGVRFMLNFALEDKEAVDRKVAEAVALGGSVVQPPHMTYYGWYQAVLLDLEANVFRLNYVPPPDAPTG